MASIWGYQSNVTGTSGASGYLSPKDTWYVYILPRGAHASAASAGTNIAFDSASSSARFSANDWVQVGLSGANVRQVTSVGGGSINVNTAVTVAQNDRVYRIGTTQPTISGSSAIYQPATTIYPRDDNSGTPTANSLVTTDSNGMFQFFSASGTYDAIGQDTNRTNQFSIVDLQVLSGSILSGIVNVVDYGAVGDGSVNDTTAIRNALLACGATGSAYNSIYFPPGRYYIAGGLTSNADGLKIEGAGGAGHDVPSVSEIVSDQAITLFTYNADGVNPPGTIAANAGLIIRDIGFRDTSANSNQVAAALRLHSAKNYHLENVAIQNLRNGVGIVIGDTRDAVNYGTLLNVHVEDTAVGISTVSTNAATAVNGIHITGGLWDGPDTYGSTSIAVAIGTACDTWSVDNLRTHSFGTHIRCRDSFAHVLSPRMEGPASVAGIGIELDGSDSNFNRQITCLSPVGIDLAAGISIGPGCRGTHVIFPRFMSTTDPIVDGGTATSIILGHDPSSGGERAEFSIGYRRVAGEQQSVRLTTTAVTNYGEHPLLVTGATSGLLVRDSLSGYAGGLYLGASSVNYGSVGVGSVRDTSATSYRASGVSAVQMVMTDGQFNFYGDTGLTANNNYTPTLRASVGTSGFLLQPTTNFSYGASQTVAIGASIALPTGTVIFLAGGATATNVHTFVGGFEGRLILVGSTNAVLVNGNTIMLNQAGNYSFSSTQRSYLPLLYTGGAWVGPAFG